MTKVIGPFISGMKMFEFVPNKDIDLWCFLGKDI